MTERLALVVDDILTNRLIALTLLRKAGWLADEADCGEIALTMAAKQAYQLVLLDISMPGLSGEETCARLRELYADRPLRIVAYTAHAFEEDRNRFLAAGFDDILVKPINRDRLLAALTGA